MSADYPPKLVGLAAEGDLLVLELSSGQRARLEISAARLARLLGRPLERLTDGDVDVFLVEPRMSHEDWEAIRRLLTPAHFSGNARIAGLLRLSAAELSELPLRLYGGTGEGRSLYTSPQVGFRRRPDGRFHALLDDGADLWSVQVHLETGQVEVGAGSRPGHFVAEDDPV
ncbi:MAG: hypothetical protein AB7N76_32905 [Planctomycetota bacterium]